MPRQQQTACFDGPVESQVYNGTTPDRPVKTSRHLGETCAFILTTEWRNLEMATAVFFETPVNLYQTTRRHIP